MRTKRERHQLSRRNAQLVGLAGFCAAACLPVVLWRRAIELIASDFRLELGYLVTGWSAYALIGIGLLFLVPVLVSVGRSPESWLYPRSRNAYLGWGVSLYVMGFALALQVAQIAQGPAAQ